MERSDSVDLVSGKNRAGAFRRGCIPSMGQMMPHSMMSGKNEPRAMYVALRSLSTAQEMTKPKIFVSININFCVRIFINKTLSKYKPKHMPHNPVSMTSKTTQSSSPRSVRSNTEKLKIKTSVVWKHITRNCVVTCDARISIPVTPDTRHRSKMPSLRSINMAPDVKATDKKKMMLWTEENPTKREK